MQFREEPRPPSSLSEWASPSQVNDIMRQQMADNRQHYAGLSAIGNNYLTLLNGRYMLPGDLGLIDENLDDKIGMEP